MGTGNLRYFDTFDVPANPKWGTLPKAEQQNLCCFAVF
jgi:hypothetical protein